MIDASILSKVLSDYKKDFITRQWQEEKYKWEAVKHFQDYWDINAADFVSMFSKSIGKTGNLLLSYNYFPAGMIIDFAKKDSEATRAMFINLFDENKDLIDRVESFITSSEKMRAKYGEGTWKQHFQNANSVTTYLWLRYPDKYYIFKYSEFVEVSRVLDSDFTPKRGATAHNIAGGFRMYDEISKHLADDKELVQMLQSSLTESCYPDPALKTLTIDVGFYISRNYPKNKNETESDWFPKGYSPNITKEQWVSLLSNPTIFTLDSLKVMKRLKDFGGAASCIQLADKYGESYNFYNNNSTSLARRVQKKTGCPMPPVSEDSKWWPILYLGKFTTNKEDGVFIWKLRNELNEALDLVDLSSVPLYTDMRQPVAEKMDDDPGNAKSALESKPEEVIEKYSKEDFLDEVFMSEADYETLVSLLKNNKNIILKGAPGVGKTFTAQRLAYAVMGVQDKNRVEFIQFHQNYSYEDFVMGYKPQGDGFELKHGCFYRFCQKAMASPGRDFFFIIDEINRGNMSKIFGELLMLIEKDYRGHEITLAYDGKAFTVPENLYLIGMMNTADRSLAMIDYALRRRFSFFEMEPGYNTDGFRRYQAGFDNETFNELIERIGELNREIIQDSSLGRGFCIGHSYFCNKAICTDQWMREVVEYSILPMLEEYWFDKPEKITRWTNILRGVLND